MKINKSKSTFVSGADAPDEKDIAKAVKGDKFASALSALESATTDAASAGNATRAALCEIAVQYDLSNEENQKAALQESAEFLVKSRLGEEHKKSEKILKDLSRYVSEDPFMKSKLLSVLEKLREETA
jgi:hypothetical protein